MSTETVRLISALLRDLPPARASRLERAAWFERKANAFDAISSDDPLLAEEAANLADGARAVADQLRHETGGEP